MILKPRLTDRDCVADRLVLPGGELLTKTEERDFDWDGARWKQLLYTSRYTRNKGSAASIKPFGPAVPSASLSCLNILVLILTLA